MALIVHDCGAGGKKKEWEEGEWEIEASGLMCSGG
jgi:hypothetical protein